MTSPFNFVFHMKQIGSMMPWVCSVIDHIRRQMWKEHRSTALEVSCSSSLVINENDFCKLNERYLDDKLSNLISFPYLGYFFSAGLRTSMLIWPANQNRFLFRWKAVLKTIYQRAKREDKTISISIFHSLVLKSMTFQWAVRKTCCPNIINIDRTSVPHGV